MPSVQDLISRYDALSAHNGLHTNESDAQWWARVGDLITDEKRAVPMRVRDAFKGPVAIVRLTPGTVLYKFNDYSSL